MDPGLVKDFKDVCQGHSFLFYFEGSCSKDMVPQVCNCLRVWWMLFGWVWILFLKPVSRASVVLDSGTLNMKFKIAQMTNEYSSTWEHKSIQSECPWPLFSLSFENCKICNLKILFHLGSLTVINSADNSRPIPLTCSVPSSMRLFALWGVWAPFISPHHNPGTLTSLTAVCTYVVTKKTSEMADKR